MSRSITQNTTSNSAVVGAGSTVIQQVNTTTGFTAGDYVYNTPTGIGTRATGNVIVGSDTPYVGTTWISTGIQSANFRAASLGPLIDQATYSGTTRTIGSTVVAASTVLSTASNNSRSCTLANGNIVQMYSQGANLYFRVIDVTGTVVVAQTTLTTSLQTSTNVGGFACCTLVSGNIQFIFNVGTAFYCNTAQYSPTGSVVVASTATYVNVSQYGNLSMAALSGGGSVVCGSAGYTSLMSAPYCLILDSTGAASTYFTGTYSSGQCRYMPIVGLPASYGTNIWAYYTQDSENGAGSNAQLVVYSNSSVAANFTNTYSTMNSPGGGVFNMTFTTDGYILAISYFGGPYYFKAQYTKSTNTTGTITSIGNGSIGSGNGATVSALPNGGASCVSADNSGNIYVNTATSAMAWNSQVQVGGATIGAGSIWSGRLSATTASGVAVINYLAASTSYNTSIIVATIPATNGSTVLTGNSYTPSTGYNLIGVAATTAAANATGQVIVNGTAQLGSAYPTATTPIYYSYQSTAGSPFIPQRGVVSNTTVTLKGLEA